MFSTLPDFSISVGGTPLRTYTYEQNTIDSTYSQNVNGRLATITYPTVSYDVLNQSRQGTTTFTDMFSYTAYGAVAGKRLRVTKTNPYGTNQTQTAVGDLNMSYAYNAEGKLASVVYPTDAGTNTTPGYNYSYDPMMRPNGMTDQNSASVVSGVVYGAANEMQSMTYDGGTETRTYNTMFQLTNITFSSGAFNQNITYNFPAGTNNGKIASQSDAVSGETVTYQYDSLNRLLSASAASWSQSYTYDGFGNLTGRVGTGTAQSTTISTPADAATNRLSGYSYDANGNLLSTGNLYDAENRLMQATMAGGTIQYFYDGQNKRVWQGQFTSSGDPQLLTIETVAMFGAGGQLAGTYTPQPNWTNGTISFSGSQRVYFAGKLIKQAGQNPIQDRLGSVGKYYPYGEERNSPPLGSDQVKFATYTRDGATGLDYADQRYYTNVLGRFMTPDRDLGRAKSTNEPLSWNLYTYAQNNPIDYYDPKGQSVENPDGPPPILWCDWLEDPFCLPPIIPIRTPPQVTITCGLTLLSQGVYSDNPGFPRHSYLDVTIQTTIDGEEFTTDYFIEGLPVDKNTGKIDDTLTAAIPLHDWLESFVEVGDHHYHGTASDVLWQTPLRTQLCPAAFSTIAGAASFPVNSYDYDPYAKVGYNSNSFIFALTSYYTIPNLPFLSALQLAGVSLALNFDPRYVGWGGPMSVGLGPIPPWP